MLPSPGLNRALALGILSGSLVCEREWCRVGPNGLRGKAKAQRVSTLPEPGSHCFVAIWHASRCPNLTSIAMF